MAVASTKLRVCIDSSVNLLNSGGFDTAFARFMSKVLLSRLVLLSLAFLSLSESRATVVEVASAAPSETIDHFSARIVTALNVRSFDPTSFCNSFALSQFLGQCQYAIPWKLFMAGNASAQLVKVTSVSSTRAFVTINLPSPVMFSTPDCKQSVQQFDSHHCFVGSSPVKDLHRPVVHFDFHLLQSPPVKILQIHLLREVLAKNSDPVLV